MNGESLILAIETALPNGSLSLLRGKLCAASRMCDSTVRLSENLLPSIAAFLGDNSLRLADIDLIAVSTGPGSLTGIRVGMSIARALAFGLNIPCVEVSLTGALKSAARASAENKAGIINEAGIIIILVPLGKNRILWEVFAADENSGAPADVYNVNSFADLTEYINGLDVQTTLVVESTIFPEYEKRLRTNLNAACLVTRASDNTSKYIGLKID